MKATRVFLTALGLLLAACLPANAKAKASDPGAAIVACMEKSKRLTEDVDAATHRYGQALLTQGHAKEGAWDRATCQALKATLVAGDRQLTWKGQESPICAQIVTAPKAQASLEGFAASHGRLRVTYASHCR
ncbi:hypothetical protein [Microvirga rosea]|uniref:hypothetical protein n=1 Tax=Microvirga rosea TaxID=2715425 RepID=UPI001D0AF719|nr:hypothetical protein [Microvirga rosea]MCB8822879.1 hypothetical protein [Microvirga rosea]